MLIMYIMDNPSMWEDYLHLSEFAYNNGYKSSLGMSPYQALYGREYWALISWDDPMNQVMLKHDMVKEMEQQVIKIWKKLKVTQDRKKSYANLNRVHTKF